MSAKVTHIDTYRVSAELGTAADLLNAAESDEEAECAIDALAKGLESTEASCSSG